MRRPHHETAPLEGVDHERRVRRVGRQRCGEITHRDRTRGDTAQRLDSDEAQIQYVTHLAPAVVAIEDERAQRLPGLAFGRPPIAHAPTATNVSSSANSFAVSSAVPRAHRPDAIRPKTNTPRPQPAMIHHANRLASTKPARSPRLPRPELSTEPTTATPSVAPSWRLVEAIAAATPAWLRGMPDTAVLVIGAFTMPNPNANTL